MGYIFLVAKNRSPEIFQSTFNASWKIVITDVDKKFVSENLYKSDSQFCCTITLSLSILNRKRR